MRISLFLVPWIVLFKALGCGSHPSQLSSKAHPVPWSSVWVSSCSTLSYSTFLQTQELTFFKNQMTYRQSFYQHDPQQITCLDSVNLLFQVIYSYEYHLGHEPEEINTLDLVLQDIILTPKTAQGVLAIQKDSLIFHLSPPLFPFIQSQVPLDLLATAEIQPEHMMFVKQNPWDNHPYIDPKTHQTKKLFAGLKIYQIISVKTVSQNNKILQFGINNESISDGYSPETRLTTLNTQHNLHFKTLLLDQTSLY